MNDLANTLIYEPDAFVTIRGRAPGHIYAELVREGRNVVIGEGVDIEDALEGINDILIDQERQ